MGGKRIDCTPTPAMWIGLQSMVSPSYKAAYAIGSPNPSVLTHAPGALRGRAGYSPKTPGFYPNEPAGISLQTTLLHGSGPVTQQIKPTHFIKVINNGFAFLRAKEQLA